MKTRPSKIRKTLYESLTEEKLEEIMTTIKTLKLSDRFALSLVSSMGKTVTKEKIIECSKFNPKLRKYDLDFLQIKYSITKEQADKLVKEHKSKKVTSEKGFITRHGEEKGKLLFKKFQDTSGQSNKNLRTSLVNKYGEVLGLEKFSNEMRRRSKGCKEFYLNKGIEDSEAIELARNWNLSNAGLFPQQYKDKGYTDEEVDVVFELMRKKKGRHNRNRSYLQEKYGNDWLEVYYGVTHRTRTKMEKSGRWMTLNLLEKFQDYKKVVDFWTKQATLFGAVEDMEKRGIEFHLDHMFSKKAGFINEVCPKIIGSKYNLKIITQKENTAKKEKCSISLDTLLNLYYENK